MTNKTKGRGNVVSLPQPHLRATYLRRLRFARFLQEQEPPTPGPANHDIQPADERAEQPEASPRIR
jgi:hypothetical protein